MKEERSEVAKQPYLYLTEYTQFFPVYIVYYFLFIGAERKCR